MDAIFGKQNFRNEIVWHYGLGGFRAKSWFPRKHDIILFYVKGTPHTFRVQRGEPTKAMLSKYRHRDEDGATVHAFLRQTLLPQGREAV